jgi:AcrR family transcriptional regulator
MNAHSLASSIRDDTLACMGVSPLKAPAPDELLVKTRRRQIFLAVCRVLVRKSFHQATVKEIAVEAGLAAGSLYVYLHSKEEILLLLADSMIAELLEALPEIRERSQGDPRKELLGVMRGAVDVIDRYREAFSVLNHEIRYLEHDPESNETLKGVIGPYRTALSDPIIRGKALGLIHFNNLNCAVEAIHMLCSGWAMGGRFFAKIDKEIYWREIAAVVEGRFFAP